MVNPPSSMSEGRKISRGGLAFSDGFIASGYLVRRAVYEADCRHGIGMNVHAGAVWDLVEQATVILHQLAIEK